MCGSLTCQLKGKVAPVGTPAPRRDPFSRPLPGLRTSSTTPTTQPAPVARTQGPRVYVGAPQKKPAQTQDEPVQSKQPTTDQDGLVSLAEVSPEFSKVKPAGGGTGFEGADVDCWTDPSNAACSGNPNTLAGKQSTASDWNAVGTISSIGRSAADLLGAWSQYQTRERTADREDRRLELQAQATRLENETRLALAEIQARGGPEAARVAADLNAQLARLQGQSTTTTTALLVVGGVVVAGTAVYLLTRPHRNPASRGRKLYKGRR